MIRIHQYAIPSRSRAVPLIAAGVLVILGCGQVTVSNPDAGHVVTDAPPGDAPRAIDAPPPDAALCNMGDINVIEPTTGGCYMFFSTNELWDTARALCEGRGAHLVTITDDAESAFVTNLVGTRNVWTGGNDRVMANAWEWVTGEPFVFTNWDGGEPDNPNEHCMRANGNAGGRWHDTQCDTRLSYICERP